MKVTINYSKDFAKFEKLLLDMFLKLNLENKIHQKFWVIATVDKDSSECSFSICENEKIDISSNQTVFRVSALDSPETVFDWIIDDLEYGFELTLTS